MLNYLVDIWQVSATNGKGPLDAENLENEFHMRVPEVRSIFWNRSGSEQYGLIRYGALKEREAAFPLVLGWTVPQRLQFSFHKQSKKRRLQIGVEMPVGRYFLGCDSHDIL